MVSPPLKMVSPWNGSTYVYVKYVTSEDGGRIEIAGGPGDCHGPRLTKSSRGRLDLCALARTINPLARLLSHSQELIFRHGLVFALEAIGRGFPESTRTHARDRHGRGPKRWPLIRDNGAGRLGYACRSGNRLRLAKGQGRRTSSLAAVAGSAATLTLRIPCHLTAILRGSGQVRSRVPVLPMQSPLKLQKS
jgi:hypothetical protein